MTNDTIADMLTRIRNANLAKHQIVQIPSTKVTKAIAKVLLDEGLIESFEELDNTDHQNVLKDEDSSISPILTDSIDKKQSSLPQSNNDNIDNNAEHTLDSPSNDSKNDLKSQNLSLDEHDPIKINICLLYTSPSPRDRG